MFTTTPYATPPTALTHVIGVVLVGHADHVDEVLGQVHIRWVRIAPCQLPYVGGVGVDQEVLRCQGLDCGEATVIRSLGAWGSPTWASATPAGTIRNAAEMGLMPGEVWPGCPKPSSDEGGGTSLLQTQSEMGRPQHWTQLSPLSHSRLCLCSLLLCMMCVICPDVDGLKISL